MIPRQEQEPYTHYDDYEGNLNAYMIPQFEDVREVTAHETADMICQILSGDGRYYGLGMYSSLHRETYHEPKRNRARYEHIAIELDTKGLTTFGFTKEESVRLVEITTKVQRRVIKNLISYGISPKEVLEQMKLVITPR